MLSQRTSNKILLFTQDMIYLTYRKLNYDTERSASCSRLAWKLISSSVSLDKAVNLENSVFFIKLNKTDNNVDLDELST